MAFKYNPFTGNLDATYTDDDVKRVAKNNTSSKVIYVSQDLGNDTTGDGSLLKPFKTIQKGITTAELTAAWSNQVIVSVYPSTGTGYVENLTFSQQGVVLRSELPNYRSDVVMVRGNVTINLTGTAGGGNYSAGNNAIYIQGFIFTCSTGNTITFSGTTFQRAFITGCYIDVTGTGSAVVLTNTGLFGSTKSTITAKDTDFTNGNSTNPTIKVSAGRIFISGSNVTLANSSSAYPSLIIDGASATGCVFSITNGQLTGQVQVTDNLSTAYFITTSIDSGANACITTPSSPNTGFIFLGQAGLNCTATNSITGSGIVVLSGVAKQNTGGDIASTVTQSAFNGFPQGATLIGTTATQTTNSLLTVKNGHIKLQQTTAPAIVAANSGTGATATLTTGNDHAGRINYTTGTGIITTTATVTITFNKAFNNAPIFVLTPQNVNAGRNLVQVYVTTTTTTAVLNFATAPLASTAYKWFYHVLET